MEENKHPEIIVTKSDQNQDNLREALKNAIEDASNDIEMKIIWKLLEACIQSILTYRGETWNKTKKEIQEINRSLDNKLFIKKILMIPP